MGDDGGGLGVVQNVRPLTIAVEDIDGDEDDAEFDAGQVEIDHLHAIGEIHAEAVAGFEPAANEEVGESIAARVDFAEGEFGSSEFERHGVAPADQRDVEEMSEVHAGNSLPRIRLAVRGSAGWAIQE